MLHPATLGHTGPAPGAATAPAADAAPPPPLLLVLLVLPSSRFSSAVPRPNTRCVPRGPPPAAAWVMERVSPWDTRRTAQPVWRRSSS